MDSIEEDFVNDDPLGAEQTTGSGRPRRRPPSVLEPRPRRREQIRGRPNTTAGRTELFLRENPVPIVIGALSLPFIWPLFRSMKQKIEESTDAVTDGVKGIEFGRYTKPLRKRWKSWIS